MFFQTYPTIACSLVLNFQRGLFVMIFKLDTKNLNTKKAYFTQVMYKGFFGLFVISVISTLISLLLLSCKTTLSQGDGGSYLSATGVSHEGANSQRCGDGDFNVYSQVYQSSVDVFSQLSQQYQRSQMDSGSLSQDGRNALNYSYTMIKNIMGENQANIIPDRPVHPAAFFAVVKDFATSMDFRWGDSNFVIENACGDRRCNGTFQVTLGSEQKWDLNSICGPSGLGVLGAKGGADYCAKLFWWTIGGDGNRCAYIKDVPASVTSKPHYNDGTFCQYNVTQSTPNMCNQSNPWTVNTFAYGHYCSYGQSNQWGRYGIHDSWRKLYTGFQYQGMHNIGYEQCAAKKVLQKLKSQKKCVRGAENYTASSSSPPPSELIQVAVADFACETNIIPGWLNQQNCPFTQQTIPSSDPGCENGYVSVSGEIEVEAQSPEEFVFEDEHDEDELVHDHDDLYVKLNRPCESGYIDLFSACCIKEYYLIDRPYWDRPIDSREAQLFKTCVEQVADKACTEQGVEVPRGATTTRQTQYNKERNEARKRVIYGGCITPQVVNACLNGTHLFHLGTYMNKSKRHQQNLPFREKQGDQVKLRIPGGYCYNRDFLRRCK